MTTYHPFKVNLSDGQKEKLARAYKTNSSLTIRLKRNETIGRDELLLTANQINRINKARALGNGAEIKISKAKIREVLKEGGSLFSAIIPLARSLAPTLAKTLGLSALVGAVRHSAGDARETESGNGYRRCEKGKSNALDNSGLWITKLPHIPRGDCGGGRRRGAIFTSS